MEFIGSPDGVLAKLLKDCVAQIAKLSKWIAYYVEIIKHMRTMYQQIIAINPLETKTKVQNSRLCQLDYYKREFEKAMNSPSGGGGETIEARIEMADMKRTLKTKSIKLDELRIQVSNVNEELEDSINELTKVSKRNSLLS